MSSVVEKKRTIALNVCATLFVLCVSVEAQQPKKVTRIGWLSEAYVRSQASPRNDAFLQGLQDLGYQEGKNMLIEHRSAGGKDERLARLAAELVRLNVDLIVALEPPAARAAKNATETIPIVMRSTDDPVRAGLVASLAKPGGNITGVTSVATELIGKRLELFKEIARRNVRLGILWNPEFEGSEIAFDEAQSKARGLGMQVQSLEVRSPGDLEKSFRSAHGAGA